MLNFQGKERGAAEGLSDLRVCQALVEKREEETSPKTRWFHLQYGMSTAINGILLQKSQKYQTEGLQGSFDPVPCSKAILKRQRSVTLTFK